MYHIFLCGEMYSLLHALCSLLQYIFEIFGLRPLASGGFKQSGIADNSALVRLN